MKNVRIITHPLVRDLVTKLRDFDTDPEHFRHYTKTISNYLIYEALQDIPTSSKKVVTQTEGLYRGDEISETIKFYGVLREGIGMLTSPFETFPWAKFDLVGVKRNDDDPFNSPARLYYGTFDNLKNINRIVIMDQMLATGGTMLVILDDIVRKNKFKGDIDIISVIVAEMGAKRILKNYPTVKITCAGFDTQANQGLNKIGYIYPGLGDASDRFFNNVVKTKKVT